MIIVKNSVLSDEYQKPILRKVSSFYVAVDKTRSKYGANPMKTARPPNWITTKKHRQFTPYGCLRPRPVTGCNGQISK